MDLDGKLALVTGASSGIGAWIARTLAGRGARLILVARGQEALQRLADELAQPGREAIAMPADLSDVNDVQRLAEELLVAPGAPDLIVNNAGAGRWRAVDENDPGEARDQIALPYLAAFELTRALLPAMIARGSGHVLNMTSVAAYVNIPGAAGYGTSRWAMRAFSDHLRADLRDTGIGVSLLAPAEVDSPYFDNNPGSRERIPRAGKLMGKALTEAQVAEHAVRAVEREKRELIVPWRARLMIRTTPGPLMRRIVSRTGWKRPQAAE